MAAADVTKVEPVEDTTSECVDPVIDVCDGGTAAFTNSASSYDDLKQENDFEAFCNFAFPEVEQTDGSASTSQPFYFESDHLALKGNDDYRRLLRAFVLLESQRSAAIRDLDMLFDLQQQALTDPQKFVDELRRGGDIASRCPRRQKVAELPSIAWERYTDDVEAVLCSLGGSHHSTRQKQKRELITGIRESIVSASNSSSSTLSTARPTSRRASPLPSVPMDATRGSVAASSVVPPLPQRRPATFNQPWTADEQRRLERLLQKYPPERFESRRFAKIAAELKGRTLPQVASRVQKYFIKLAKAGLPVPGRAPNLAAYGGRGFSAGYHRHQRYNRMYYPSSTFLASYEPPVYMSDDDGDDRFEPEIQAAGSSMQGFSEHSETFSGPGMSSDEDSDDDDDNDMVSVPTYLRDTAEYRELQLLTSLRRQQRNRLRQADRQPFNVDNKHSVSNFSTNCSNAAAAVTNVKLEDISADELMTVQSVARTHVDPDYTSAKTGISSYLDPNYLPAV